MYYLDPPYSNTEAGYNAYLNKGDDDKLYEYIINIDEQGSSFMLSGSLNHDGKNSPLLDKLINDNFGVKKIKNDYNKVSKKGNKNTEEVIIKNY